MGNKLETVFEKGLFASRWLLAPFYMGLILALIALLATFFHEIAIMLPRIFEMKADETILLALALIDLSLAGNLILIVIFSGYENFVSRLDVGDHKDRPDWMGKVDFSGLKLKLVASIVAISGIHLLKVFMNIGKYTEQHIHLMVIIHLTFVISGVLLALMDWLTAGAKAKISNS